MRKRFISLMTACCLAAGLTAGCAGGGATGTTAAGGSTGSPAGTGVQSEAQSEKTQTGSGDSKAVSGKLTFVHCEGNDKPGFQALMKAFQEEYPNVEIEASYMVNSELKKNMQINMLANNLPDVLVFDSPDFAYFAANGYFMDVTDALNEWGELENFYEGPLSSVTYNDRLYGLPWYSNNLALFYNKEMLTEAGVEPPTTWEEFRTAARALTKDGVYGFGMALPKSEVATFQYIPWLYSAGGDISDLSSDAAKKSLTFISDLVNDGVMSKEVINWAHGDLEKAFIGKQVAMVEFGSWGLASLGNGGADFEWGVVPMPMDEKTVTVLGGYDVGISKDCKNPEAALAFLKFIGSKKQVTDYAKSIGNIPVRKDINEDPFWNDEKTKVFVDQMENSVSRVNPFWPDLSANIQTAIQEAVTGAETVDEALAKAQEKNAPYWQ